LEDEMATYESKMTLSLLAAADLSSSQYYALRLSAANTVNVGNAIGCKCIGLLQNTPGAAGRAAEVAVGGRAIGKAGGTIAYGDPVESTAAGLLQKASGYGWIVGFADEAATSGALFAVNVAPQLYNPRIERFTSDGALTAGLIVTSGTADDDVAVATVGSKAVGVVAVGSVNNAPAYITTYGPAELTLGGTVTRGQWVVPDADGKGRAAGYLGGKHAVGIALDSGVAAGTITVLVCPAPVFDDMVVKEMIAGADLSAAAGLACKVGAADNEVIKATAGSRNVGILQSGAAAAGSVNVAVAGIVPAICGAAVGLGNEVISDLNGKVINSSGTAGHVTLGIAVSDTAGADETVYVLLTNRLLLENPIVGIAAGYKLARGVASVTGASDVTTGLATVVACVASLGANPVVTENMWTTCAIGAVAGHIDVKTWKPTAVNDCTPQAGSAAVDVSWIAIGT
jgi:hypothetical protein